ncbi:MAG: glutamine-hydrolyzing carbamoyl-phosphate synthase small subunit [Bdellovibrionales bacterium]|nr:glutamine-hydrolyzing carbamoyl-phosphate synthase small subunit [Bdellovibrionales bacterium]
MKGFVVLQSGETFPGEWVGEGKNQAGELVFNTSHSGYEEIATDPSYFNQIVVMTNPMQGNYGSHKGDWESEKIHIRGVVCLQMQSSDRDRTWIQCLEKHGVPILQEADTRELTLFLRDRGTPWGAVVKAADANEAKKIAAELIPAVQSQDKDWVYQVSTRKTQIFQGNKPSGSRLALIDYGFKKNILRELQSRSSEIAVFSSRVSAKEIQDWNPDGIVLSNGPGDPADVQVAVQTIKDLLSWKPIFGICMGNQLLSLALGGKTYKLAFGHRGSNHPVRDELLGQVYMTSQNHGYVVDPASLPSNVKVTHLNLYDKTLEGIECAEKKCFSVQYHPESHPGPRDGESLFDLFVGKLR